jgi:beta-glucosidase
MTKKSAKIGIIGCGNISDIYLQAGNKFEVLEIVACADLIPERAQAKAAEYDIPKACSPEELLADPGIDIVVNLTIPQAHAEVALAAVEAGKSVYNEKPLAINIKDGALLMQSAKVRNVRVGCAPDTFLGGGLQTCRKLLDEGQIGRPVAATAFMMSPGHEHWHPDPEFFYQTGGGPMLDMGPYYLTTLVSMLGSVHRVTGSAQISYPQRTITSQPKYGQKITVQVPTHVAGVLDFASGLDVAKHNWWNECLHGVGRAGVATVFPQAIGMAATWNPALIHQVATATSDEARAKHHETARRGIFQIYSGLTYWTPNVNMFRDPRWGRGQETYGEDPYLTASMAVAFVKSLQGDDPNYLKLVATPKHYAVHSGPEANRHHFDAQIGERDMYEYYLPAFEACIKEGNAVSIMGAYNRLNGEPCCASLTLLERILRQEWNFNGYVVSDCWAIVDIYAHHNVVETPAEAAALAVKNGCDLNCGSTYPALKDAVEQGLIDEATIDRAVKRLFNARFRLGMFDPPEQVPYANISFKVVNSTEHQELALQTARETMVLLKNDNLLPLSKNLKSIAVIGPNADDLAPLVGNYNGTPAKAITPLEGIRQKVSAETIVYYARGCPIADGVPAMSVIPQSHLRSEHADAAKNGLTGAYYDNLDFSREPVFTRTDSVVDFFWKNSSPLSGEWGEHFSVRWSGHLIPPVSGIYALGINGFNNCQLYLNDELVLEYENIHHPALRTKLVDLEAGRLYRIRLDLVSHGLDPQIKLMWAIPETNDEVQALEAAQKADAVVMVLGLSPRVEGEEMPIKVDGFVGGDRTNIALPRGQQDLLQKVHALGKPVVLVLMNGSAVAICWAAENVPAILQAWYPGEAGGIAIADVLFGDYNPGGRLPVTFYKSVEDLPPFENYQLNGHTYRYFQGEPLYPFGYGLSYTTFAYNNLNLSSPSAASGDTIAICLDVINTGNRTGDEVVQLYVKDIEASVNRPIKELIGFQRVNLQPGEKKTITFEVAINQLGFYNHDKDFVVEPGMIEIMVGASSEDLPLKAKIEIIGKTTEIGQVKKFFSKVTAQ